MQSPSHQLHRAIDDIIHRAIRDMLQVVESLSGAKSAEFYVQMAAWLVKTASKSAATYRSIDLDQGLKARETAAIALDELVSSLQAMLRDFHSSSKPADEVKVAMDAIPAKIEQASREMVRAAAATAGYAITDEDLSVEDARSRILEAMMEARRPASN